MDIGSIRAQSGLGIDDGVDVLGVDRDPLVRVGNLLQGDDQLLVS